MPNRTNEIPVQQRQQWAKQLFSVISKQKRLLSLSGWPFSFLLFIWILCDCLECLFFDSFLVVAASLPPHFPPARNSLPLYLFVETVNKSSLPFSGKMRNKKYKRHRTLSHTARSWKALRCFFSCFVHFWFQVGRILIRKEHLIQLFLSGRSKQMKRSEMRKENNRVANTQTKRNEWCVTIEAQIWTFRKLTAYSLIFAVCFWLRLGRRIWPFFRSLHLNSSQPKCDESRESWSSKTLKMPLHIFPVLGILPYNLQRNKSDIIFIKQFEKQKTVWATCLANKRC